MRDGTTSEERANFNWNTVWDGKASRSDRGWITEMAIPFKSLRYRPGREQTWGTQLRRLIVSKNEAAYLTPVSPAWGRRAIHHFSEDAMLVGLEALATRNLEIKPYATSTVTTDRLSRPPLRNDVDPDGGIDVKYGLTKSLTADFTYNTDFAQVEVDEAQVNLTRFSLVFPEKRQRACVRDTPPPRGAWSCCVLNTNPRMPRAFASIAMSNASTARTLLPLPGLSGSRCVWISMAPTSAGSVSARSTGPLAGSVRNPSL